MDKRECITEVQYLEKRDNETQFDYHKRIIYGKLVDKTLADVDYAELSEMAYGQPYSSDVARRMFYGSKRTLDLIDDDAVGKCEDGAAVKQIEDKIIELKKERQKFFDQRNAFNKVVRERSRQEELNEILEDSIRNGNLPRLSVEHKDAWVKSCDNDLLVSLNDIHYGLVVNNAWNHYDSDVCASMMSNYVNDIIRIGRTHGSENCYVYNCGDSISGNIHTPIQIANKENVVEQVKGVSELIAEFLATLAGYFDKVVYVSVPGNHSRVAQKDDAPYNERLDDLVEWYLKARLMSFGNIVIDTKSRVDATMFIECIRGKEYCGVHGDFDCSESKIASLQTLTSRITGRQPYAVLMGHKHHNESNVVQGVRTFMAGSFLGMDDYCVQKRIYGTPEQLVCVCSNEGVVCQYGVPLYSTPKNNE